MEPYWKVRALCYFFSLDIIGEKETLIRRIEEVLFNNYLLKKNPDDALKETADMSLEYFLKNTKFAGKRSKGPSLKELEALLKDGSSLVKPRKRREPFCVPGLRPSRLALAVRHRNLQT